MTISVPVKGDLVLVQKSSEGLHGLFLVDSFDSQTSSLFITRVDIDPAQNDPNWPVKIDLLEVSALYTSNTVR